MAPPWRFARLRQRLPPFSLHCTPAAVLLHLVSSVQRALSCALAVRRAAAVVGTHRRNKGIQGCFDQGHCMAKGIVWPAMRARAWACLGWPLVPPTGHRGELTECAAYGALGRHLHGDLVFHMAVIQRV